MNLYSYVLLTFFFLNALSGISQSKKEQIEVLSNQIDSLRKIIDFKELQVTEQLDKNVKLSKDLHDVDLKNKELINVIALKEKQLKELSQRPNCPSGETEFNIIMSSSGEDPTIMLTTTFQGMELVNYRQGINETYPNRAYSFEYFISGLNNGSNEVYNAVPAALMFNSKIKELEEKINAKAQEEFKRMGVAESKIPSYHISTSREDEVNSIHFFIQNDHVTFYISQEDLEVNDRMEISFPLHAIVPYLMDFSSMSNEELRKHCFERGYSVFLSLIINNVEEGDMGTYIEFINPETKETFDFAFWNWKDKMMEIDVFAETWWQGKPNPKSRFIVELRFEKVPEYEYKGGDIGNEETGRMIETLVLYGALIEP